jgi:hypothetical protein
MAEELREVYGTIPGVVRGLFKDREKGLNAGERLLSMGMSTRDLDIIPITAAETRRVSRSLLEAIGLRKAKARVTAVAKFEPGEIVVLVRLREWSRDKVEKALKDLGADELEYFGPPGEGPDVVARVAPARIGGQPAA